MDPCQVTEILTSISVRIQALTDQREMIIEQQNGKISHVERVNQRMIEALTQRIDGLTKVVNQIKCQYAKFNGPAIR